MEENMTKEFNAVLKAIISMIEHDYTKEDLLEYLNDALENKPK